MYFNQKHNNLLWDEEEVLSSIIDAPYSVRSMKMKMAEIPSKTTKERDFRASEQKEGN